MAGKTKTMTQIRKILQGLHNGWSLRKIAERTGIARNTVRTYLRRVEGEQGTIGDMLALKDAQLSQIVLKPSADEDGRHEDLLNRLPEFEKQLRQVGVTRKLLWEEYCEAYPQGYGYSQFCEHLHRWRQAPQVVMHLKHEAGDLLEVDFAG